MSPLLQPKGWEDGGPTLKQHCVNTPCFWIAKWSRISGQLVYNTMPSKHDTSTQCRFNAGPPSPTLAINHSTLDSAFCWRWWVHRAQAGTDPISVKCWASVDGAGHIAGSMVGLCSIDYTSTMLWTVGPPSVTMGHIQCDTIHDPPLTQYWANVGLAS